MCVLVITWVCVCARRNLESIVGGWHIWFFPECVPTITGVILAEQARTANTAVCANLVSRHYLLRLAQIARDFVVCCANWVGVQLCNLNALVKCRRVIDK